MPNITSKNQNEHKWEIEMEADLSAAAAVTATRGTNVTCTKSSTATYTFVVKGTSGLKVFEVLHRNADVHGTPAAITRAIITSVTQATDGTDDLTIVVKTTNATFVETATTGACTLSVQLVCRTARMSNPFS
jgi:hypothetical protein